MAGRARRADHVDLVFSNAGIGGGGSFIADPRGAVGARLRGRLLGRVLLRPHFLPLLIRSPEGVLVNTSSVNGFWASRGGGVPHTAYSTAKFAVKGLSEALIEDLRVNAPHVRVAVVMPGHVATNIVANSMMAFGVPEADALAANQGFHDSAPLGPRRAPPRSFSTQCGPARGASWSARTPTAWTGTSAPTRMTPTTTPSWPRP